MIDLKEEYRKCYLSPIYFIENYLRTFDKTRNRNVPFILFEKQKEILNALHNPETLQNLLKKPRQAGASTVITAYIVWMMVFADEESPEEILIVCNKLNLAKKLLKKVYEFYDQLPEWLIPYSKGKPEYVIGSQTHIELPNKTKVAALATATDAIRGYTPTFLLIDEAAFIDNGDEFWLAVSPALGTGGRVILNSTPNGRDPLYYAHYRDAMEGKPNSFNIIDLRWYEDPRYNKDLTWKKGNETIVETDKTKWREMEHIGWKPTSPWFERECARLGNDERKINQELRGNFNGSGDDVYEQETMDFQEQNNIQEPYRIEYDKNLWIWKDPIPGHKYVIGVDTSTGESDDFAGLSIVDSTDNEQVAEYRGKIPSEVLAELTYTLGLRYNTAFCIIDTTGGYGESVWKILINLGYKALFYVQMLTDKTFVPTESDKPGINFTGYRVQIIDAGQQIFRAKVFKIHSSRLIAEMRDFIYKNGRPDHPSGGHDDLIMAISMALFVIQNLFSKLESLESQTKAMLENWFVNDNMINDAFRPIIPVDDKVKQNYFVPRGLVPNHENYAWLFA